MHLSDDRIAHKSLLRIRAHANRQRGQDADDMVKHAGRAEQAQYKMSDLLVLMH